MVARTIFQGNVNNYDYVTQRQVMLGMIHAANVDNIYLLVGSIKYDLYTFQVYFCQVVYHLKIFARPNFHI